MAGSDAYSTEAGGEKIQYRRSIDQRSSATSAANEIAAALPPIRSVHAAQQRAAATSSTSAERSAPNTRELKLAAILSSACNSGGKLAAITCAMFVSPPLTPSTATTTATPAHTAANRAVIRRASTRS